MGRLLSLKKVRNILILVAVDGSESSKNALLQSLKFARKQHCGIKVATVIPSYEGELNLTGVKNIADSFREPGEKVLTEARELALGEGIEVETILTEGTTHEEIVDLAVANNCDLIVMGRRGASMFDTFMGTTTARVIGYSPIDVLVMPRDTVFKWDNILLAVDCSKYSEIVATRAISLAQAYGSEINVLSVVDVPEEAFAEAPHVIESMAAKARDNVSVITETAKSAKLRSKDFVREGTSYEKILELANELGADVICMGSHGRTGIRRLLMGSVTEKVIGHAKCPVLVVKSH
jgi:nucleotide-binding universal stress UspA family protein